VYGNSAYVATTNRCGGVEDGVWTLNLQTKKVSQWKTQTGSVAGAAGIAAGPDGTVYVATTGGELAALEPNTLKQTASAKLPGVQFTSSPVVFEFHGKDLVAVSGNDGRIYLFDTKGLGSGKPLATSAAFSEPGFETGSLTTWVDQKETRWILAAAGGNAATKMGIAGDQGSVEHGAIAAWKVVANSGGATLEPGWVSRDLIAPLPPIVENGVVFALSSGEFRTGNAAVSAAERAKKSTNAVLYALDGDTGKELWNSGGSITSFVHSGGLAGGETRVYLADYEGNEYAFGVPIEH
jgi:outer membrane protein assembly factor BamB